MDKIMTADPVFDIVIVNHNSTDFLLRCLASVYTALDGIPARIFVQDNASGDDVRRLKRAFPWIHLTVNTRNLGFAAAVNQALARSTAEYVVLLNPDTLVEQGFFATVLAYLRVHPDVGILGPRVLDQDGSVQGSARGFPTPLTALFGRSSFLSARFPHNRFTQRNLVCLQSDGRTASPVDWVSGACMVIRNEALRKTGRLDERFYIYWEDADLCRRFTNDSWKVVYFPLARCYHFAGKSSDTKPCFATYHFHRSCYLYFEKYATYPLRLLLPLAFAGLSARCILKIGRHCMRRLGGRHRIGEDTPAQKNKERIQAAAPKIVVRIVSRLNIGGPATHISILLRKLEPARFETLLIAGSLSPHEGDMSYLLDGQRDLIRTVPAMQREISPLRDLKAFFRILDIIRKVKPDLIHTHMAKAGTLGRLAALSLNLIPGQKKIETVHTFHGHVLEGYFGKKRTAAFKWIETWLAGRTSAIIAISKSQKHELAQVHRIVRPDKVRLINLGFDLSRFVTAGQTRGLFRAKHAIDDKALVVGIVGRLVPIKNHYLFLRAAHLFRNHYHHENAVFAVVGDGELREDLEAYARRLGIGDRVLFCGWEREIHTVYADLDIVALTSNNEGTPVSLIEAMAAGVPLITTGVGGVEDLLGRALKDQPAGQRFVVSERGVVCPREDPRAFAAGLDYIARHDATKKQDRLAGARRFVLDNYSDKRLVQRIEQLYDQLLRD